MVVGKGRGVDTAPGEDLHKVGGSAHRMVLLDPVRRDVRQRAFQVDHRQVVLFEHLLEIGEEIIVALLFYDVVEAVLIVPLVVLAAQGHVPREGNRDRLFRRG